MIRIEDLVLYDLTEVAAKLKLSRSRVGALVRAEELAGVVHGGRWMVAKEEVVRFKRTWKPPERVSQVGRTRRFVPPPPPADLFEKWE